MDKNYSIGQIIFVNLVTDEEDCLYKGEYHSMNHERTRLTLADTIYLPDNKKIGLFTCFRNEIKEMRALDASDGLEAVMDNTLGRSLAHHKGPSHAHLSRMSGQTTKPAPEPEKPGNENWRSLDKYKDFKTKLDSYTVISAIDDTFRQSIDALKKCFRVALALEGVMLGRHGTLCWINMATEAHTYLFDMVSLSPVAYDAGLRELLQSSSLGKTMHDCRMASDYLLHRHNIKLINVYDTQVLELLVKRVQQEKCPSFVSSLHHCIRDYLRVPPPILMFPLVREDFIQQDLAKWLKRPLAPKVLELAVINVAFLDELRQALMKALLNPATQGTQFFLNHVSSMSDADSASYYSCIHLTPRQMFSIGRKRRGEDERGMQRLNPHIRFSRDVMHYFEADTDSEQETTSSQPPQDKAVNGITTQLQQNIL